MQLFETLVGASMTSALLAAVAAASCRFFSMANWVSWSCSWSCRKERRKSWVLMTPGGALLSTASAGRSRAVKVSNTRQPARINPKPDLESVVIETKRGKKR
jgi:hypothetical protein